MLYVFIWNVYIYIEFLFWNVWIILSGRWDLRLCLCVCVFVTRESVEVQFMSERRQSYKNQSNKQNISSMLNFEGKRPFPFYRCERSKQNK